MKLKNIRIKKYKLMRLYLAKYEVYKKEKVTSPLFNSVLDRLEINLKKVLFLIYQYHILNKKILFIGLPYSNDTKIINVLLASKHIFVPRSIWHSGLIGNKSSISVKSKNFSYFKNFLELSENPSLVVLFNEPKLYNVVPECQKLSIPTIYFGRRTKGLDGVSYVVEGNFVHRKIKNFVLFLMYSILKKSKNLDTLKNRFSR
jgi:hypothetical protein